MEVLQNWLLKSDVTSSFDSKCLHVLKLILVTSSDTCALSEDLYLNLPLTKSHIDSQFYPSAVQEILQQYDCASFVDSSAVGSCEGAFFF